MNSIEILRTPPTYCHYADGPCDQDFSDTPDSRAVFLYPAKPEPMARTIETAAQILNQSNDKKCWRTWREFQSAGQIVFCTICKNMRFSDAIIADVTTLNFNLMFEIGFALGLETPLLLIRDISFMRDSREFRELGILEGIGYIDFQNSNDLVETIRSAMPITAIPAQSMTLNINMPLYLVKSHISTEGQVKLVSIIDQSPLNFRSYDPIEDPPLSLHDVRKQVSTSFGVIGHLLMPERDGAIVHNARCALIAGMAAAAGKVVMLFQEGRSSQQPIDYRDLVLPYTNPQQIDSALKLPIERILERIFDSGVVAPHPPQGLLEKLDLGDIAAENEIQQLRSYFVQTGQYHEARRGNARLVIGRKGSGKTAIFYAIRDSIPQTRSHLVLDMKPEGYQFRKLREEVLTSLPEGLQEHTLTAFWVYILLCELCRDVINRDVSWAQRDPERFQTFNELRNVFEDLVPNDSGDFSERLLRQVDRLSIRFKSVEKLTSSRITELLFQTEIPELERVVANYLTHKSEVWILIDNLDKGWPTRGTSAEDILIIRALLDATRKIQRKLERHCVAMHSLLFLRNDIYDLLVRYTPDRGKDTPVIVDWDDPEAFKELVLQRMKVATGLHGSFDTVWSAAFERNIGTRDSFRYIVERTLMRPRDLIRFLRKAVEVAVNRGHELVEADDFTTAERMYSEELLLNINYELSDVSSQYTDLVYEFIGCKATMSVFDATNHVSTAVGDADREEALQLLIWFGFLGVSKGNNSKPQFAYDIGYNLPKISAMLKMEMAQLVVHPAFRTSLDCQL